MYLHHHKVMLGCQLCEKGGYIILFLIIQFSCELFLDTNHSWFSQEVLKKNSLNE